MGVIHNPKTVSDLLFERYLRDRGLNEFVYEPRVLGSAKSPDYQLPIHSEPAYFEVKEFESGPTVAGSFDPYAPIREKINVAARQLRPLKGRVCAVVLANHLNPAVVVNRPFIVMGAMLGNAGISMPVDVALGKADSARIVHTFLEGGKMAHRGRSGVRVQNRTISALCVLEDVPSGIRNFGVEVSKRAISRPQESRDAIVVELLKETGTDALLEVRHLRLVTYENPFALVLFPDDFGVGPWDERWAIQGDGTLRRVFVGTALKALEELEHSIEVRDPQARDVEDAPGEA